MFVHGSTWYDVKICELICTDNQVFCINLASGLLKLYSSETDGPIWPPFFAKVQWVLQIGTMPHSPSPDAMIS